VVKDGGKQLRVTASSSLSLSSLSTQSLVLTFVRFKLEEHPDCAADFLQIHDGYNPTARRIGRYCGASLPGGGSVNTTHFVATLFFHADASVSRDGFALTWRSVDPSQCTRRSGAAGIL